MQSLRQKVADYMREHPDDFMPFLSKQETGEVFSEGLYHQFVRSRYNVTWLMLLKVKVFLTKLSLTFKQVKTTLFLLLMWITRIINIYI